MSTVSILYFCSMKRLITYCLLTVTLIFGVASTTVYNKTNATANETISQHQSWPQQSESNFSNSNFLTSVGLGNGQTSLLYAAQSLAYRITTSFSNTARINHLVQLQLQQLTLSNASYLLQSAFNQRNGYYLYHLCKLLI